MRYERAIKSIKERRKVKKTGLVLGLALLLIFAFAVSAMAATTPGGFPQNGDRTNDNGKMPFAANHVKGDNKSDYLATTDATTGLTTGQLPSDYVAGTSRIHSHYTDNTNACASCHAIHTAVGPMLLQWESDQATCEACHNGTLGNNTYDVKGGTIGTGVGATQAWGGVFGDEAAPSSSMHNVSDGVKIGAAPGGNTDAPATDAIWGQTFGCMSCHDAHGTAGNGRILNPKVNGANYVATTAKNLKVIDATNKIYVALNPVIVGATDANGDPDQKGGEYAKLITGHGNDLTVFANDGTTTLALGTDYTVDNNGEITKITFIGATPPTAPKATYTAALQVKMKVDNYLASNEKVTYIKGMNDFCGACHTDYNTSSFYRTQAQQTLADTTKVNLFENSTGSPYFIKGKKSGVPAGGATATYNVLNGQYHEAYRHGVGRFSGDATQEAEGLAFEKITLKDAAGNTYDKYNFVCTTCHVAHGTNETVWGNFANQKDASSVNLKGITSPGSRFVGPETGKDSNLKRMPNMATCETCHQKGAGNAGMAY